MASTLTMSPPRSKPDRKTPEAQLTLSPLFAHSRATLTVIETARALGITDQQVRDLVEAGQLRAFAINDNPNPKRQALRILRSSVEAFFLERYLEQNGEEFPLVNSAEVSAMRARLRALKSHPL